jgi:RNA polymerase sigma-70 factor (ECF subfamily)
MFSPQKEFSKIYDQYIGKIYRFIFLKVNSQETAQDLTSETFTRAWSKFNDSQDPSPKVQNWQAFLYQIARNLLADFYRENNKFQVISASSVADPPADINLEEQAILGSDMEQVRAGLAKIGEEQQEVIIWRYLDGLSTKEIAEILGKPEGTIRVILHRALATLRGKL